MKTLNNIWYNSTYEFTPLQRKVIAVVLGCIFSIAFAAFILLAVEVGGKELGL